MKKFFINTAKFAGTVVAAAAVVVIAEKTGLTEKVVNLIPGKSE